MLISFTVSNYRSFREPQTLSLEALDLAEYPDNVVELHGERLLKSAIVYGGNASGKSNLLQALIVLVYMVAGSAQENSKTPLPAEPFLLSEGYENEPSVFDLVFLDNGAVYQYIVSFTKEKVVYESLAILIEANDKKIYERNHQQIVLADELKSSEILVDKCRPNALFISVLDQFNSPDEVLPLFNFLRSIQILSTVSISDANNRKRAFNTLTNYPQLFNELLSLADVNIKSAKIEDVDISIFNDIELKSLKRIKGENLSSLQQIITFHNKYDNFGNITGYTPLELARHESDGTRKIIVLIAHLIKAIQQSTVLIIDEIELNLHLLQVLNIIRSINRNEVNSQLICTTHMTGLLKRAELRRDQFYFIDKDDTEASVLYSLAQIENEDGQPLPQDEDFEAEYLAGRYGAINYPKLFANDNAEKKRD